MTASELSEDVVTPLLVSVRKARVQTLEAELDAANARADAAEAKVREAWAAGYNTVLTMLPPEVRAALGGEAQS